MENAFEMLGATPLDNNEKLKELFEEKQLLLDNDKELAEVYSALTTPKKRIRHEIEYFAKEEFESFNEIFVENADSEQKMNLHDTCSAIINLGRWFDSDINDIYTQINDNREISGFSKLSNSGTVVTAISELRANCVNSVTKYFEFIDEKGLVKLFNELVEYEDFTSFFVDELMAHYEIKITDSLQTKQKICTSKFAEVERLCNIFNNGGSFSYELEDKVAEFKKAMSAWDKLAQPLQVNSQQRGAEHKGSAEFVNKTRNTVIGLCNRSQDMLGKLLEQLNQFSRLMSGQSYASDAHADINAIMSAREKLPQKIKDSVKFTDIILKLLDILRTTFAENEIVAELLKKDKKDISELKKTLSNMLNRIDPYGSHGSKTNSSASSSSYGRSSGGIGWWSSKDSQQKKKWGWGIFAAIVVVIIIIVNIVNATAKPFEGSLNGSNFKNAFSVSGSASSSGYVSYSITSKESGYASSSRSSNEIKVTIKYTFSGGTSGGRTGTKEVTLKKSEGYKASGSIIVYGYFSYSGCSVTVTYAQGSVYLD